jgi:hypothetical protein
LFSFAIMNRELSEVIVDYFNMICGWWRQCPSNLRLVALFLVEWQKHVLNKHLLTYRAEPFLRSWQLCSHSGNSQHFKEPEGSSPCSQESSTGSYPEPDRSSSYHTVPSYLSKIPFNIVHPPTSSSS